MMDLPTIKIDDRVRIMQTDGNIRLGTANICGQVKSLDGNYCIVQCDDGKKRKIHRCTLMVVPQKMYDDWRANGIDTAKGTTEKDIKYPLGRFATSVKEAQRLCFEIEQDT